MIANVTLSIFNLHIPEGVTLVVPDGSTLVMQSMAVVKYTPPEGEETVLYSTVSQKELLDQLPEGVVSYAGPFMNIENGSTENTAAHLIIADTAKLIIEQAAAIISSIKSW